MPRLPGQAAGTFDPHLTSLIFTFTVIERRPPVLINHARRVATLAEGRMGHGRHVLTLDASSLPSGVYLIRARILSEAGTTQMLTRRVVLMK
jgi:hypothetical protein